MCRINSLPFETMSVYVLHFNIIKEETLLVMKKKDLRIILKKNNRIGRCTAFILFISIGKS